MQLGLCYINISIRSSNKTGSPPKAWKNKGLTTWKMVTWVPHKHDWGQCSTNKAPPQRGSHLRSSSVQSLEPILSVSEESNGLWFLFFHWLINGDQILTSVFAFNVSSIYFYSFRKDLQFIFTNFLKRPFDSKHIRYTYFKECIIGMQDTKSRYQTLPWSRQRKQHVGDYFHVHRRCTPKLVSLCFSRPHCTS